MTLKNFFSAKCGGFAGYRENLKRRSWVCLLCVLVLILVLPIRHAMEINADLQILTRDSEYLTGTSLTAAEWLNEQFMRDFTGDILTAIVIAGLAVAFAIQGFSWMNSSRKLDLYFSVPISSRRRFRIIYTNGILFFAVTYLFMMLLTALTATLMGAGSALTWVTVILMYLGNMIFYLAVYNLTLIAAMLTGKVLITLCGTVVLFGYEFLVRTLIDYLSRTFYRTYSMYSSFGEENLTSPVFEWMIQLTQINDRMLDSGVSLPFVWDSVGLLAVQALVYGCIAWLLYRKRRAEAAGKAMAFAVSKPIIKFALVIPISLLVALWFWELSSESLIFAGIGMAASLLIGHGLIQVIYEADIRSVLHRKGQLLAAAILSSAVFAGFYLDVTGYDAYIPESDEIRETAISLSNDIYSMRVYDDLFEKDMKYISRDDYMLENLQMSEPAVIEAVRELALQDQAIEEDRQRFGAQYHTATIRYTLQNGRKVYRDIIMEKAECVPQLDVILQSPQYQQIRYQVLDERFAQHLPEMEVTCSDGVSEWDVPKDTDRLTEALAQDLKQYDYSLIREKLPVGEVVFHFHTVDRRGNRDNYQWGYPVYASFSETLGVLADNDIRLNMNNGSFVSPDDVAELTLTCWNSQVVLETEDRPVEVIQETTYYGETAAKEILGETDWSVTETFTDREDLEAILPAVYPQNLLNIAGSSMHVHPIGQEYEIILTFRAERKQQMRHVTFSVLDEKLPEYIRERLTYKVK